MPLEAAATRWAYAGDGTPLRYRVWTQTDLRWVDEDGRWPGRQCLVRVETMRAADANQPLGQQRSYTNSRALAPPQADRAVRGYWVLGTGPLKMPWHLAP